MALWYSLWSFGTYFPVLVCLYQEKSGNPETSYIHTYILFLPTIFLCVKAAAFLLQFCLFLHFYGLLRANHQFWFLWCDMTEALTGIKRED
jgi:hypothetical protein